MLMLTSCTCQTWWEEYLIAGRIASLQDITDLDWYSMSANIPFMKPRYLYRRHFSVRRTDLGADAACSTIAYLDLVRSVLIRAH